MKKAFSYTLAYSNYNICTLLLRLWHSYEILVLGRVHTVTLCQCQLHNNCNQQRQSDYVPVHLVTYLYSFIPTLIGFFLPLPPPSTFPHLFLLSFLIIRKQIKQVFFYNFLTLLFANKYDFIISKQFIYTLMSMINDYNESMIMNFKIYKKFFQEFINYFIPLYIFVNIHLSNVRFYNSLYDG